jgi:hypothetical protein
MSGTSRPELQGKVGVGFVEEVQGLILRCEEQQTERGQECYSPSLICVNLTRVPSVRSGIMAMRDGFPDETDQ